MSKFPRLPEFMENGSHGPIPQLVISFLCGAGYADKGLRPDQEYGPHAIEAMSRWQHSNGLADDGGCGPETRECMRERWGFDIEMAAQSVGMSESIIVQPNGDRISWPALQNLGPAPDPDEAAVCDGLSEATATTA